MSEPLLLTRCGRVNPYSLEDYEQAGGYLALRKALQDDPEAVVTEVKASRLWGRGGAAFPAGIKWEAVANSSVPEKYVVCNADESEPGTFKDRKLLEEDPFSIVEAVTIAGYAVGALRGYIYLRGEYFQAHEIMLNALGTARRSGYLGESVLDSNFSFDIQLRSGAGAYICGEETALFNSIEGFRGEPRMKPPYPTTHGLFQKPTLINNVETLANIPHIVERGGDWYASMGTEESTGVKLFSVSGHVQRPGVYEVEFGLPLRTLIYDLAGGPRHGRELQAVLCGGAAGSFVGPEDIDVALDSEAFRNMGSTLGSGAIMVFDETADLLEVSCRLARFFAHESCGKCVPCRVGTQRQLEVLERVVHGGGRPGDAQTLRDLAQVMQDASICGLGQTASTAVLSALDRFSDGRIPTAGGD